MPTVIVMRRLLFVLPSLLLSATVFAQTPTTEPAAEPAAGESTEPAVEDPVQALQERLARQEEETALLRQQLVESQRQSEQLQETNARLENVDQSVQDLHNFERQREMLAERQTETLARAVVSLERAGNSLFHGNANVLDDLEFASSALEGDARRAALFAAELVRRGDLFNARSWVQQAQQQAQAALTASGLRVADNPK